LRDGADGQVCILFSPCNDGLAPPLHVPRMRLERHPRVAHNIHQRRPCGSFCMLSSFPAGRGSHRRLGSVSGKDRAEHGLQIDHLDGPDAPAAQIQGYRTERALLVARDIRHSRRVWAGRRGGSDLLPLYAAIVSEIRCRHVGHTHSLALDEWRLLVKTGGSG